MTSLGIIPMFGAWLGFYCLARELAARRWIDPDWRFSWILACVGWGTALTFLVEAASLVRSLKAGTMFGGWAVICGAVFWGAVQLAKRRGLASSQLASAWRPVFRAHPKVWPVDVKVLWGSTGVIVIFTGLVSLLTAPSNYDSLTYHLPRVLHWIQQASVEHYATGNGRQIEFGPWSAFVITQLQLFFGNDWTFNLVQWFSMVTTLVVSTLLSDLLLTSWRPATTEVVCEPQGDSATIRRVSAFAAFLCVTLPIGLLESMTTQTDYNTAAWMFCYATLAILLVRQPGNLFATLGAALALGLGILTKSTMFIYAAPLSAVLGVYLLVKLPSTKLRVRMAAIFVGAVAFLNANHMARNMQVFGSPLGSVFTMVTQRNHEISMRVTYSNVIRNLAMNMDTGFTPASEAIGRGMLKLHRLSGLKLNDPRTTFHISGFGFPRIWFVNDSVAASFYHLLFVIAAGVAGCIRLRHNRKLWLYFGIIAASAVMFCAYLRWQDWHSRLQMTYFLLLMPWVSVLLVTRLSRWSIPAGLVVLLPLTVACLAFNQTRPLANAEYRNASRERQYFVSNIASWYDPVSNIVARVLESKCDHVGLNLAFDDAEYPIWVMLRNRGFKGRIDHVGVETESGSITNTAGKPCIVISAYYGLINPELKQHYPQREAFDLFVLRRPGPATNKVAPITPIPMFPLTPAR